MCLILASQRWGPAKGPYTCGNTAGPPVSSLAAECPNSSLGGRPAPHSPASHAPTHACSWWPESSTYTCRETPTPVPSGCSSWKARLKVFCSSSLPVHLGGPCLVPSTCRPGWEKDSHSACCRPSREPRRLAPTMVFFPLSGRRQPIICFCSPAQTPISSVNRHSFMEFSEMKRVHQESVVYSCYSNTFIDMCAYFSYPFICIAKMKLYIHYQN